MQAKTDLDRSFKGPGIDCLVEAIVWRPGVGSVSSAVTSTLFGDMSLQGGRAFILHRVYLTSMCLDQNARQGMVKSSLAPHKP